MCLWACACACTSPSLSEDSCVGSGVVLLLSVFWLQLDGWLLAFLCFPFTPALGWVRKFKLSDSNITADKLIVNCIRLRAEDVEFRCLIISAATTVSEKENWSCCFRAQMQFGLTNLILTNCVVWRCVSGLADLLLAGPAVAVGEPVLLSLVFLMRLNHSVLLKLNQTPLRLPRLCAVKQENNITFCRFSVI